MHLLLSQVSIGTIMRAHWASGGAVCVLSVTRDEDGGATGN